MKIFINGKENTSKCILYEFNNGEILEFRNNKALFLANNGDRIIESPEYIQIEEKGKNIIIQIDNEPRSREIKDVRKIDFS